MITMKKFVAAIALVAVVAAAFVLGSHKDSKTPAPVVTTTTTAPEPTTTTTVYVAPTTTTTTVDITALKQDMSDRCYGELWSGEKSLSDGAVALAKAYSVTKNPTSIATARKAVATMKDSAAACKGVVSSEFYGSMLDVANDTSQLVELYASES